MAANRLPTGQGPHFRHSNDGGGLRRDEFVTKTEIEYAATGVNAFADRQRDRLHGL